MLKVSPKTVRRWIDRQRLPAHRFGHQLRVADADLRAFVAAAVERGSPVK